MTAPPVASDEKIWMSRKLTESTREMPETAASPQEETMTVSATPMVTAKSCSNDRVELQILEKVKNNTEPSVFVTLYLCLTKGDKMDTAVRQAVEMGVSKIVPVLSTNCVSRPDDKSLIKKQERWQKIADEAAGQSGRGILPEVTQCISFKKAAELIKNDDLCLFFYEIGGTPLDKLNNNTKTVSVIIGPEGGFSKEEAEKLESIGARVTTLGPRILRAETAPVAAVAAVMLQSGNM